MTAIEIVTPAQILVSFGSALGLLSALALLASAGSAVHPAALGRRRARVRRHESSA